MAKRHICSCANMTRITHTTEGERERERQTVPSGVTMQNHVSDLSHKTSEKRLDFPPSAPEVDK